MVIQRGRKGLRLLLLVLLVLLVLLLVLLVLWRRCWRLMLRGMVLLMMVMVLVVVLLVRLELLTGQIKSAETLRQWGQSRQGHRDAVVVSVSVDENQKKMLAQSNSCWFNTTLSRDLCNFFLDIFKHNQKRPIFYDSTTFAKPIGLF